MKEEKELYCLSQRSYQAELMDEIGLQGPVLEQNLRELALINHYLGGNQVMRNALRQLAKKNFFSDQRCYNIADLGSGGGDNLRVMAKWFAQAGIEAKFLGLDYNETMLSFARENSQDFPQIQYQKADIFSEARDWQDLDIVSLSLFCHHFTDTQLVDLFKKLYQDVSGLIIINDLQRHPFAYHSIRWLTKIFRGSYLVQNDAPLSVKRAFKASELESILKVAGVEKFQIRWLWAFRYQVIFGKSMR